MALTYGSITVIKLTDTEVFLEVKGIEGAVKYQMAIRDENTGKVTYGIADYRDTFDAKYEGLTKGHTYVVNYRGIDAWGNYGPFMPQGITFVAGGEIPVPVNPWKWKSLIKSGEPIKISASEWNSFCGRINEFRTYKGLSKYNFTTVVSGVTPISSLILNQAVYAISSINVNSRNYEVNPGDPISADIFLGLRDVLNAVK